LTRDNDVIEDVKKELGEEAGGVKIVVSAPGKPKPQDYYPKADFFVPETGLDPSASRTKIEELLIEFADYRDGGVNTKGTGSRRILKQKVGEDGTQTGWEEYEHSSEASARWIFHREVQRQYKWALGVVNLADPKLDARVGIGSPAHKQVRYLADEVVNSYIKGVRLVQRRLNPFKVGAVLARPDEVVPFANAVHGAYAGLNTLERPFADAIDQTGLPWARNPARSGYGIPLISVGPTSNFYPDFLVWTAERVICVDTKGPHLVHETARRKLLRIRPAADGPRLDVQFVSKGTYDDSLEQRNISGYTSWGMGDDGTIQTHGFEDMEAVVKHLIDDAVHRA
jgi:type III restriction enzyme